VNFKIFAFV